MTSGSNCRHLKRPETEGVSRSIELAYQITPPKLQHFHFEDNPSILSSRSRNIVLTSSPRSRLHVLDGVDAFRRVAVRIIFFAFAAVLLPACAQLVGHQKPEHISGLPWVQNEDFSRSEAFRFTCVAKTNNRLHPQTGL